MAPRGMDVEKVEARQNYRNLWHTDLMRSPQSDPLFCCLACWCGPCVSFILRKRALYNDLSRYTCCGGFMPCSGKCGERNCPAFCLCAEVSLCFANSVASTRFMLQDEFNIQTTKCDNCIIGFMLCVQQLACIFSLVALIVGIDEIEEASQLLNCLADTVYCTVCPCMQTQHKIEMDKRDGKFGQPQIMAAPPVQQMSRADEPIGYPLPPPYPQAAPPPLIGYHPPPPPPYGGQAPPLAVGYPPTPYGQPMPPPPVGYPPPPPYGQAHGIYPPPPQPQDQSYSPAAAYPPPANTSPPQHCPPSDAVYPPHNGQK